MTDYTELVKALRHCANWSRMNCADCEYEPYYDCTARLIKDAAAAIEALQAVIKEADKKQEYQHDCICELTAENEELKDEVKRLEPKRGEIVLCGECKHHEDEEPGMVYCPKIVGSWVSENWFCEDGEREVQGGTNRT